MTGAEVLIATADGALLAPLRAELEPKGLVVRVRERLDGLTEELDAHRPRLLVIDLDLTDDPGGLLEALSRPALRVAFVAVTARYRTSWQVVAALRSGALDCILKPCDPKVLAARLLAFLRALDRRRRGAAAAPRSRLKTADDRLTLDLEGHRCFLGAEPAAREIRLTPKEFLILSRLLENVNRLVSKQDIAALLWPEGGASAEQLGALAQHIAHLRRKLGPEAVRLKTLWGLGYRLED